MNEYFKFKQFTVHQDRCAMKVGTDAVLLGAWTDVSKTARILDVGAGTGLIALMCAQRSANAQIDTIEFDLMASSQAAENCRSSPWNNRLRVVNDSFQSFSKVTSVKYDLIISNPPFFRKSLKSPHAKRSAARHDDELTIDALLYFSLTLLSKDGRISLIYPSNDMDYLISSAFFNGLYPAKKTFVRPRVDKDFTRCLVEFTTKRDQCDNDEIAIKTAANEYTARYKELTKEFYLKF